MRDLEKNSRAIAGAGIAPLRAAVSEIFENLEPLADDVMRLPALDVDDKADPARIFLVLRVVEPLLVRKSWNVHVPYPVQKVGEFPI